MYAARTAARRAARLSKNFATAVDAAGVKVAAVDNGQATSSVSFVVKAGSRYETKAGLANVLKNFAFKNTSARSAIGTVREAELYGGVLSSTLTREHLAVTAEFLRGDEAFFVDVLASIISSSKFQPWELAESVLPVVAEDTRAASEDPITVALELAHSAAFRTGLGASLFAPAHLHVSAEEVKAFADQVFTRNNIAVIGTGISQDVLTKLVEKSLQLSSSGSAVSSSASKYFGGEARQTHASGPQTVVIGFGIPSAPPFADLAVLAAHLSTSPSIKWSPSLSPIAGVIPAGTSVTPVLLPYSDASLFGLVVQGQSGAAVKEAAAASIKILKEKAGGLKAEELKAAVAKAKFSAASALETRDGFVSYVGSQVLAGSDPSISSVTSSLDAVTATNLSKTASALINSKPTFVAVGETSSLPHSDEIGL